MRKLTREYLMSILNYDVHTGIFTWKINKGRICKGTVAGNIRQDKYCRIKINYRDYYAHRLAWLYVNGVWPENILDHKNNRPDDNSLSNLRIADVSKNSMNSDLRTDNKLKIKGVSIVKNGKRKYKARIQKDGVQIHIGTFYTEEEARKAYIEKSKELFGPYART